MDAHNGDADGTASKEPSALRRSSVTTSLTISPLVSVEPIAARQISDSKWEWFYGTISSFGTPRANTGEAMQTNRATYATMSVILLACGGRVEIEAEMDAAADTPIATPVPESPLPDDTGPSSCARPSNGCNVCGNLVCPKGSGIDSACKCLRHDPNYHYVTPVAQPCDACCGRKCSPGRFLDYRCECYTP